MPRFSRLDHIALTVSDLDASAAFYERVFGFGPVGALEGEHLTRRIFTLPDGTTLGLTRHDAGSAEPFTPFTPGLDHLGFGVDSIDELQRWADHLSAAGVQHDGLVEASYGTALSFKDPDGIALEFFHSA